MVYLRTWKIRRDCLLLEPTHPPLYYHKDPGFPSFKALSIKSDNYGLRISKVSDRLTCWELVAPVMRASDFQLTLCPARCHLHCLITVSHQVGVSITPVLQIRKLGVGQASYLPKGRQLGRLIIFQSSCSR